jgi:plasmid stabilization system protein ParE
MRTRLLTAAELELMREVAYYSRARIGLGQRFLAAVESVVDRASRHPQAGIPTFGGTRRMLVKGFPFSVVYAVEAEELLVIAIAAHRRQPGYWRPRLGSPG